MTHWERHFENYDLFMKSFSKYKKTIKFHILHLQKLKVVLDDGCGTGNLTLALLLKKHEVIAIDQELKILDIVKNKCRDNLSNLKLEKMDGQNLKYSDNTFDGASSMFVIPFVKDNKKYLSEIFRVLKPGGKAVISAWAPKKDIITHIAKDMEREYKKKKILPKYKNSWKEFLKTSKINGKSVILSYSTINLKSDLKEIGFIKINKYLKNPYKKYALFITCKKPIHPKTLS
jgi:ubiquinone/menaquinone biosynthesis C-methylase UbiE